jgi:hypothetical protein
MSHEMFNSAIHIKTSKETINISSYPPTPQNIDNISKFSSFKFGKIFQKWRIKLQSGDRYPSQLDVKNSLFITTFVLFLILIAGTFIRLLYIQKTHFPMNDGGFFYVMIRDLQQNKYHLPEFTSYNFINIPFAYPPLSFYSVALLNQFLHIDLLTFFRFYPLIFNLISIPAFFFLSNEITRNVRISLIATAFYAVLPPSYEWLISGGGLTRSPAQTYFIICLTLFLVYLRTTRKGWLFSSIVVAALMTLHHLEYTWFLVWSMIVFVLFQQKLIKPFLLIASYGLGLTILTSPYWITIIRLHGVSPFINAFLTGDFNILNSIFGLFVINFTFEPFTNFVKVFAIIGLFLCIPTKNYKMILWFILIFFLNLRSAGRLLIFPATILAASTLEMLIIPGFKNLEDKFTSGNMTTVEPLPQRKYFLRGTANLFLIFSILFPFFTEYLNSSFDNPVLSSLNNSELNAMQWVKSNTNPKDSFLVIDSADNWSDDMVSEWFPALAQRHSWITVQGVEWLPNDEFSKQQMIYKEGKQCIFKGAACLSSWADKYSIIYTYVFVTKSECIINSTNCTNYLISTLASSTEYKQVYMDEGAAIFKLIDPVN